VKTIKDICDEIITVKNYDEISTKEFVEKAYKKLGWHLSAINGQELLYGTRETPKLMSVIRRVQLKKKAIREHLIAVERRKKLS